MSELVRQNEDPDELFELIDEIAQGSYGHVFNVSFFSFFFSSSSAVFLKRLFLPPFSGVPALPLVRSLPIGSRVPPVLLATYSKSLRSSVRPTRTPKP